jgi:hypothetical protein
MSYYMHVLCYGACPIYQDDSAIVNLRPLRSNTMEISALGKEPASHSIWRDDDMYLIVYLHQMLQASCMVAVAMRDKHIVHRTEVDAHLLSIADKHITCSCVKQDTMLIRL